MSSLQSHKDCSLEKRQSRKYWNGCCSTWNVDRMHSLNEIIMIREPRLAPCKLDTRAQQIQITSCTKQSNMGSWCLFLLYSYRGITWQHNLPLWLRTPLTSWVLLYSFILKDISFLKIRNLFECASANQNVQPNGSQFLTQVQKPPHHLCPFSKYSLM